MPGKEEAVELTVKFLTDQGLGPSIAKKSSGTPAVPDTPRSTHKQGPTEDISTSSRTRGSQKPEAILSGCSADHSAKNSQRQKCGHVTPARVPTSSSSSHHIDYDEKSSELQESDNEKSSYCPSTVSPLSRDPLLAPIEQEFLWLEEECRYCVGYVDIGFLFQHASAELRLILWRLEDEQEDLRKLIRPTVISLAEDLRCRIRESLDRGERRPSMSAVIASLTSERKQVHPSKPQDDTTSSSTNS